MFLVSTRLPCRSSMPSYGAIRVWSLTSVFPTRTGGPPSALIEIMISFGLCGRAVQPEAVLLSSLPQHDHLPARLAHMQARTKSEKTLFMGGNEAIQCWLRDA